tara:strand:+ start:132 stop:482 length:351 start_codon:yes stop_codon:yes gene_type:complete
LPTSKLLFACVVFTLGQTFAWFHINSQFVWGWWKDKPLVALTLYAIPASLCFWWGMKIAYAEMEEVWGPRFLIFCVSYFTFPLLTWYFLNESMFTAKTMICVSLSFMIMGVQLFWR